MLHGVLKSMIEILIRLTWQDFATLVRGETIAHTDVHHPNQIFKLSLEHISFEMMMALLERAQEK